MDVGHPTSDEKLHPDGGTKAEMPLVQGGLCCQNTALIWALFLVTSDHSDPATIVWKVLSEGGFENFSGWALQCLCSVILVQKKTEGYASERNVSSASLPVCGEHRWDPRGQNSLQLSSSLLKGKFWGRNSSCFDLVVCSLSSRSLVHDYNRHRMKVSHQPHVI